MSKRNVLTWVWVFVIGMAVYGQTVFGGDGPAITLTGELVSMANAGVHDDLRVLRPGNDKAPGVYYGRDDRDGSVISGKNGYYTAFNFSLLFNPVSHTDLYVKLLSRYRPGSPYVPLQLENTGQENFNVGIDSMYARINAVKPLGFDTPLDIWLKGGKFDAAPAHFHRVSRYGGESVMGNLRTKTNYALQVEAEYPLPTAGPLNISVTGNVRLNEGIPALLDVDVREQDYLFPHGTPAGDSVIPIHAAIKLKSISLPFGVLSAELIYAYNAMHIFSGHNFGADAGMNIALTDNVSIPLGVAVAFYEKNIDTLAGAAIADLAANDFYGFNGYSPADSNTTGFRQALRIGGGAGVRYRPLDSLSAEFNAGFAYARLAHLYRDPLNLLSLSLDLQCVFVDHVIVGGGIFMGTLSEAEWARSVSYDIDAFSGHVFKPAQNMGFEVFGGVQFDHSRFIIGYNMNKGLSLNNALEAVPDSQMKYRQKDTQSADGLFERGGVFAKLVIAW